MSFRHLCIRCACVSGGHPEGVTVGLSGCDFLSEKCTFRKEGQQVSGLQQGVGGRARWPQLSLSPTRVSVARPLGLRSQQRVADGDPICGLKQSQNREEMAVRKQPAATCASPESLGVADGALGWSRGT